MKNQGLSNQVLSVEQMREVIDMGIDTSNASLYWAINKSNPRGRKQDLMKPFLTFYTMNQVVGLESFEYIPAFTLQDILKILPKKIDGGGWVLSERYSEIPGEEEGAYMWYGRKHVGITNGYTPLQAAFNMLKWCKQNNEL